MSEHRRVLGWQRRNCDGNDYGILFVRLSAHFEKRLRIIFFFNISLLPLLLLTSAVWILS